jgi:hypothetical protein
MWLGIEIFVAFSGVSSIPGTSHYRASNLVRLERRFHRLQMGVKTARQFCQYTSLACSAFRFTRTIEIVFYKD